MTEIKHDNNTRNRTVAIVIYLLAAAAVIVVGAFDAISDPLGKSIFDFAIMLGLAVSGVIFGKTYSVSEHKILRVFGYLIIAVGIATGLWGFVEFLGKF